MKDLIRESLLRSVTLYSTAAFFQGLVVNTSAVNLLMSGLVFTLFNRVIKPLVKLVTLPLNLLTLGIFNWVNYVIVLALMVQFWRHVQIVSFTTPSWQQAGFSIPGLSVGVILSYIVAAIILTFIYKILDWLCQY